MNFSSIASSVASIAEKLAPAIIPGAGAAIAAAKEVIALANDLKPSVTGTPEGQQLDESLTDLEARVSAHADSVEEELGDGPAD
jgi:hypothetical protein